MKQQQMALAAIAVLLGFLPVARAEPMDSDKGWGVLSQLAGRKFVWNSGRARGSDASELTFHEFRWRGEVLAQTQCSYWPLRNMKAVCGTNLIEKLPDGSLVLKANGGKPYFKGTVAANGSVELVNKTLLGKFVTAFVARPDGAVELMHVNRIDGESRAPLLPVDATREAEIMADMESIFAAAQAQKREEAERRYAAFMGAMEGMNAVLSAGLEVATVNEARPRASLDETLAHAASMTPPKPSAQEVQRSTSPTAGDLVANAAPSGSVATQGGPLRFVLSIGLQPRAGDSVNPTCYSNVITRPGPAGWGQDGSLPPGSVGSARDTVESFKSSFVHACRTASGRNVTSEGDFHWTWNETQDGESQIANTRAQYREDVTVSL